VSFESPSVLWVLAALPLLLVAYLLFHQHRNRRAEPFATAHMMPNVVPASPRWRRYVPLALYLLGLAVLILAVARPQRAMSVPRERATVVLAIDSSRSMEATDVPPTRMEAARSAARSFLDDLPSRFQVGVVSFARRARILSRPTVDRVSLGFALDSLEPKPGTAIGDGLMAALDSRPEGRDVPLVVVLLSDGDNTTGTDPLEAAERAAGMNVKVFTIAFGGDAPGTAGVPPPDDGTLRQVAETTGASFFDAPTAADLRAVYEDLGSSITMVREKREVTTSFLGAGAILLLLGGGASALWFNRLP
jgi:Ca-activated chloride channel family protein